VLALAVIAAVIWRQYRTPERLAHGEALRDRVLTLRVLAEHLAAQKPAGSVLVIANPFARQPGQSAEVYEFEQAALRGLRQGLGSRWRLEGLAHPQLSPVAAADPASVPLPPDLTTPLSLMTTTDAWDELRRAYPNADIWVSLIGLPWNAAASEFWREPRPALALLLPDFQVLGGAENVQAAFESGKIVGAVLNRPGPSGGPARSDESERDRFDRRFLLLTKTNLSAVRSTWPELF
jgi:hypothetical protein